MRIGDSKYCMFGLFLSCIVVLGEIVVFDGKFLNFRLAYSLGRGRFGSKGVEN